MMGELPEHQIDANDGGTEYTSCETKSQSRHTLSRRAVLTDARDGAHDPAPEVVGSHVE